VRDPQARKSLCHSDRDNGLLEMVAQLESARAGTSMIFLISKLGSNASVRAPVMRGAQAGAYLRDPNHQIGKDLVRDQDSLRATRTADKS